MNLFTGERFIPGIEDNKLEIEHYQRYLSVAKLVKDKTVLDAASGEGYGSSLLAQKANQVYGLDIDEDTVERAKKKYESFRNLCFQQGSIAQLPFEDNSIDIVVSFETIEHVSEELQWKYLAEIRRVLKSDGFLIMSTPNKKIYSDKHDYHNKFHVKEFYRQDFIDFLMHAFINVKLYNQRFEVISIIDDKLTKDIVQYFRNDEQENQEGKYYIAIASNAQLPNESISSVYMNEKAEYENNIDRIIGLQKEVEERNIYIAVLDKQIKENGQTIVQLQEEERERNIHIQKLDAEIRTINERIARLIEYGDKADADHIKQLKSIQRENEQYEREKQALIQQIRNKDGHIAQLLETEREFERYKQTGGYRSTIFRRKVIDFLLPPKSKRLFILHVMKELLVHPSQWGKVVNIKNIGNYIKYMRSDSIDVIQRRYDEVVEVANGNATGISSSVEIIEISPDNSKAGAVSSASKEIEDYDPIYFKAQDAPTVSIIIPVYNQFEYTYCCLQSILKNSGDVSYEIIIANDCSTDLTQQIETVVKNIRVVTTKENIRFLLNCNNAAEFARGKYVLFLNNDTQVQDNWLAPLVELIECDGKNGMVGSKLIYPDGRLQEAGGIVWKDASAWNYGNKKNPDDPEFNYVKEADYISGAAIMIRKDLWNEIGGFDERFAPAYYEDTDLAFEVRKHGYKVMYQPLSRVVHFEGVSNGTDVGTGLKHYQQLNFEKFYEKWKDVLEADQDVNGENVFTAKDRSNHKKHILVVDHYVPHYDHDAGGRCTYMYLQLFVRMGLQVTFIGDNFFKHEPYTTDLNQMGIEVLYGNYYYNNWQDWLKENGHYFEYIYLQRPHIAIKYIDIVKQYSKAKIFYWPCDLHYIREYREYELLGDPEKLKSSQEWKKIEYELIEKSEVIHVVGSYEKAIVQRDFPDKLVRNIPIYIYENVLENVNKDFSTRNGILFVGGFGHHPNIDATLWFASEIYPKVLEKYPNMIWHIAGGGAPAEVKALACDNIVLEGFVPDEQLKKLYMECRMAVVPLRYGAGVKGKVVEANYYQIPLLTTSIGAEGLSMEEHSMLVEDDAANIAQAICNTYEDFEKLRMLSDNGAKFIQNHFMKKEAERVLRLDIDI